MKKFYVTTPIYYVNQSPHVGTAYTTIAADVLARYNRLTGNDSFFLTGTDEHGTKVQESARTQGKSPKEFTDEIAAQFQAAWQRLNISNDAFIRTTNPAHEKAVQHVLQTLYDEGHIYEGIYTALYCVGCEQYKTKTELTNGLCPDHKKEPEAREENSYLLRLSAFQERLLALVTSDELAIEPVERKNEIVSFLEKEKLNDVAISRPKEKVSWGVPLPFDDSHTTYVWVDAFMNYATGLGWPARTKEFERYWPPDVQLMAKDILRVHATIWPSILMALGLPLPRRMFVHGYFTVNGHKMSKSLGNVIDPNALADEYGADAIRYFILSEFPFGTDGDFSVKRLEEAYNFDLANDLGNLVHRTQAMISKYRAGQIPAAGALSDLESTLRARTGSEARAAQSAMAALDFRGALDHIWNVVKSGNKYIDDSQPWSLARNDDADRLLTVLSTVAELIRIVAVLISPFMPATADKIWAQLNMESSIAADTLERHLDWDRIPAGAAMAKADPLFPRRDPPR